MRLSKGAMKREAKRLADHRVYYAGDFDTQADIIARQLAPLDPGPQAEEKDRTRHAKMVEKAFVLLHNRISKFYNYKGDAV